MLEHLVFEHMSPKYDAKMLEHLIFQYMSTKYDAKMPEHFIFCVGGLGNKGF